MQLLAFFVVYKVDTICDQAEYNYDALEESLATNLFVINEQEYRSDYEKHAYCWEDNDSHEALAEKLRIFLDNYLASILTHFWFIF